MEIIFFIIALLISLLIAYSAGRTTYTHKQLIDILKNDIDLFISQLFLIITITIITFIILSAINNTFFNLKYLFI